jgi:16S rRNA (cytosine1402-N4)-methyltransferase
MTDSHVSVLKTEALEWLQVKPKAWYLDGTFGLGGHTAELLKLGAQVVALDFDHKAIEAGFIRFASEIAGGQLRLIRENFAQCDVVWQTILAQHPNAQLAGCLFDFGTSIEQLKYDDRGLSFTQPDQELDMRLDDRLGVKAKDLLLALPEKHLATLLSEYGGEPRAKKVAQIVVEARTRQPEKLQTVGGFLNLLGKVLPPRSGHLNPATKVFQALRIAVNDELTNISTGLLAARRSLAPGGRLVTIAFHEGEDKIVKDWFKDWEEQGLGQSLTKKPVTASETELELNPRSRSAKLRVFGTKNL